VQALVSIEIPDQPIVEAVPEPDESQMTFRHPDAESVGAEAPATAAQPRQAAPRPAQPAATARPAASTGGLPPPRREPDQSKLIYHGSRSTPQEPQRQQAAPTKREADKVGRNDPCPCGSGKKYKKCHGALVGEDATV
jgi:preprotein translocase subunit SecA